MMYLERDENGEVVVKDENQLERELEKAALDSRTQSQKEHDKEMELYQERVNLQGKKLILMVVLAAALALMKIADAGYEVDRKTALAAPEFHRQVSSWLEAKKAEAQKAHRDWPPPGTPGKLEWECNDKCQWMWVTDYGKREVKQ
jgi:hypothetical protein